MHRLCDLDGFHLKLGDYASKGLPEISLDMQEPSLPSVRSAPYQRFNGYSLIKSTTLSDCLKAVNLPAVKGVGSEIQ